MIVWLIVLGVLGGFLLLPIGVRATYNTDGALLQLLVGPLRFQLYPGKNVAKKNNTAVAKEKSGAQSSKGTISTGGSLNDFLPVFRVVWSLLQDFKRKLRVDRLEFKLVLAGDDPYDLSVNYGRAWAALGNLMPRLESFLCIRKRNLEIECDYLAEQTRVFVLIDLTMTIGRLLELAVRHGCRGLIEYHKLLKIRKGGA